jgi:hypothetical protein
MDKQQIIMMIDGLMDKEKRAGTAAFVAPFLGNAVGGLLSNGMEESIKFGQAEAGRQLQGVFTGNVSGDVASDAKGAVNKIAQETAKGFVVGIVNSFFPDKS